MRTAGPPQEIKLAAPPAGGDALAWALSAAAGAGIYAVDAGGRVIAANAWAERLLGYERGSLLGLDADHVLKPRVDTDGLPETSTALEQAGGTRRVNDDRAVVVRADGTTLPVWWSAAPLPPESGYPGGTVVVLNEISERRERVEARADRYVRSEVRREQVESELADTAWLSELTLAMTTTLDTEEAVWRLVRQLVPRLADTAAIDLAEKDVLRCVAWAHRLPDTLPKAPDEAELPDHEEHRAAIARVLRGGGTQRLAPAPSGRPDLLSLTDAGDVLVVPLRLRSTTLGALTLARTGTGTPFDEPDQELAEEVARRASLGLDNTRLHAAQADIAETLQQALLTDLPKVPGIELAAHYRPALAAAEVGGDWYDAFSLPGGDTMLVIGDVTGHDVQAAARMSELRNMLRALAVDRPEESPGQILRRLDTAQARLTHADSATAVLARLHPGADGSWQMSWSIAGHPPPLLLTADGDTSFLTGPHAPLLGARPTMERPTQRVDLPAGATLLLYTDGLVESRSQSIDTGMTSLREHLAAQHATPLRKLCAVLAKQLGDTRDDITLIAARVPPGAE
ncbi:SpoIIE family protein phosphatase [Streptomyces lonarensis]|uniref:protein-serine/threonine phosphatase n=1 Tax=Streptomyces lonarensis TaxID=700599 RepID=A0A7X6CZT3_9ACTN|nr:SpoIIE family protein phosphatase [Streptomyces lonarensis]NJQ05574.1 SpoIIE family protein phosphatase [Streptomyces lonarensis]